MQQYLEGRFERRMETQSAKLAASSNREFVAGLRVCVTAYFDSIDQWEAQFKRYNRLNGPQYRVPADLQQAQSRYLQARAALEPRIPRARQLCRRFEIYDPWPWILKIQPGADSETGSALSANERGLISSCLRELEFRIADTENHPEIKMRREQAANPDRGLLRRMLDYFL
jgi:hypothetical protein